MAADLLRAFPEEQMGRMVPRRKKVSSAKRSAEGAIKGPTN